MGKWSLNISRLSNILWICTDCTSFEHYIPVHDSVHHGKIARHQIQKTLPHINFYSIIFFTFRLFTSSNENLSDDQIRLQRTSTDIRAADMPRSPALDRDSTLSPSVCVSQNTINVIKLFKVKVEYNTISIYLVSSLSLMKLDNIMMDIIISD